MGLEDTPGPDSDKPTEPPAILPARSPPQGELDFARTVPVDLWPEVDQTADLPDDSWE